MIAKLKPYPAMKDSGVPWLGEVPRHWEMRRTKHLLRERVQKGFPNEPLLAATQTKGVVKKEQYENRTVLALKDLHLLKLVHMGDFVISLRSFQGGIEYARDQGIISPAYTVLYPAQPETHLYLAWLFKSKPYVENLSLYVTGIRQGQNIDYEKLSRSELPVPTDSEQVAIVRFLDHYDRKIRRYIRAKQKLIKLLEEEKQAIIHRAVTRGLAPNVRLKPSGMEWLGDIPEHWELCRAKYLFREVDERSKTGAEVLLSLRMYQGLVPHKEVSKIPITAQGLIGFKKVKPGQIVMNRMRAAIGMFGISNQSGLVSPDYAVFEPSENVEPAYFLQLFKSPGARTIFRIESKGLGTGSSGFMRLYTDRFGIIKLPLPVKEEQVHIVQDIVASTREIEYTEEHVKQEITLLREYRTRLISDVVTGKLDVRETAADLPVENKELAPLEEADALTDEEGTATDNLDAISEEAEV